MKLPFDEAALLKENTAYIVRKLGIQEFHVHPATEETAKENSRIMDARPGTPVSVFSS